MGSTVCSNDCCAATTSHEWKNGWPLRSGGFSTLCYNCGYDYEKFVFCEKYHSDQTGWRECTSCGKKLHCGCVASKSFIEFLDHGGVGCFNCINVSPTYTMNNQVPKELSSFVGLGGPQSTTVPNRGIGDSLDEGRLIQLCHIMEANESNHIPRLHQPENESLGQGQTKKLEIMPRMGEVGRDSSSLGSMALPIADNANRTAIGFKDTNHDSLGEPSLKMTLGIPSRASDFAIGLSNEVGDVKELNKTPSSASFNPYRNRPILPKPLKSGLSLIAEPNKGSVSPMRIARPPGEGRGRNQLLPRYWPRITDQELEKLSGALNSAIVPLFEKVLSASDAGRIGRLVLPKACAEAYFPAISQSEGVPLRVQDVKGNEWTFQFRFWPNNNSRMYVLEGVTPCIQAMQLQAGDTVTFSRIDPGGKLVMGFRKASNNGDIQDAEMPASPNGTNPEPAISATDNLGGAGNGYSGLVQGALFSEHLHVANGDTGLPKSSEAGGFRKTEDFLQKPAVNLEKKKTRNIGSKSKRLHMHSEDVLELRLTWEEAQDLLRPPPSGQPTVVTVEDHEFEEYEEPPVFGKRTLFVSRSPGAQEQWAQCDECSKWRRLPLDVLLPPKWTCSDNEWDVTRASCSAPDEISLRQLENLVRTTRDLKKRRISESLKRRPVPSGLDALASAAAMGDRAGGEGSSGATTRHPRHRPGCTCIVCIQPPSGKGKHKPTCTCNVCMTVKRRFKTLMLRKKKRLSGSPGPAEIPEANGNGHAPPPIDLNSHPSREDDEVEAEETKPTSEPAGYINHQHPSDPAVNADGGSQLGLESLNNAINNGVFVDTSLDRNKNP